MRKVGFPFLALGVALVAIGITSNKTFMYAGVAFLIISFAMIFRGRR